ncbi:MAG: hypothetical protein B7X28_07450, partial [Halothiobacillus sp. 13-55-253]
MTEHEPTERRTDLFWRLDTAEQVGVLIDGEDYYRAFADLLLQAVLHEALNRNPDLHIYLLAWDYSMIYALEREWRPLFSLPQCAHPRLHVAFDNHHPLAASQHQKTLVIDDRTALVGGFDPSKWRWDSTAHAPAVSGAPATHVATLARNRWALATGGKVAPVSIDPDTPTPWPTNLPVLVTQALIGIARTLPAHEEQEEAREVEAALLALIASARRFIYIENQYFTSHVIGQALIDRLTAAKGPEIVLVLPRAKDGWLERVTMDVLRAR